MKTHYTNTTPDSKMIGDTAKRIGWLEYELKDLQNNPRDQYHTMEELYLYRMLRNALAANALNEGSKFLQR